MAQSLFPGSIALIVTGQNRCEQRAGTAMLQVLTSSGESCCGEECLLLPASPPGPEVTCHGSRGGKSECASGQLSV